MPEPTLQLTYTLEDIDNAAARFWEALRGYHLFAFSGEMGAGKTTFIHKLCDHLQVEDAVSSPTFALINEYHFTDSTNKDETIYHMDWYRVKTTEEAMEAGMEDCLMEAERKEAFCFVEWPEKARELLRPPYLWISIETVEINERVMTVTGING